MAAGAICPSIAGKARTSTPGSSQRAPSRHHDDSARAVIGEQAGGRLESAARIDDDARGIGADDVTNRQSRVIRDRAADPDDDGIDEGAQPVQVRETGGAVDVAGTAGRRGDAPVERLADLTNDDEWIGRSAAQRPEHLLPWRRKVASKPETSEESPARIRPHRRHAAEHPRRDGPGSGKNQDPSKGFRLSRDTITGGAECDSNPAAQNENFRFIDVRAGNFSSTPL